MNVKLIISDPRKSDSKDILLGEGEYLIGRESKCDICIKNTSVSREHAWLIISGQDVAIQDMRSSWGTFIDGIQIMGEVPILAGQSLKIGEVSIDLELHSAEDSGAPAPSPPILPTNAASTNAGNPLEEYDKHGRLFSQKKLQGDGTIAYEQCYWYRDEYEETGVRDDLRAWKGGTLWATSKWLYAPHMFRPIGPCTSYKSSAAIHQYSSMPFFEGNAPRTPIPGKNWSILAVPEHSLLMEITFHDVEFIQNECYGESRFVLLRDEHGYHRQTISYDTSGVEVHRADHARPGKRVINGLLGLLLGLGAIIAAFIWLWNAGTRDDLIYRFVPATEPAFVAPGEPMDNPKRKTFYSVFFIFHVLCIGLMGIVFVINGMIMLATAKWIKIPGFVSWTSRHLLNDGGVGLTVGLTFVCYFITVFKWSTEINFYYLGSIIIAALICYKHAETTSGYCVGCYDQESFLDRHKGKKEDRDLDEI